MFKIQLLNMDIFRKLSLFISCKKLKNILFRLNKFIQNTYLKNILNVQKYINLQKKSIDITKIKYNEKLNLC